MSEMDKFDKETLKKLYGIENWKIIGVRGEVVHIRNDFIINYLNDLSENINNRLGRMEDTMGNLILHIVGKKRSRTERYLRGRVNRKLRHQILMRDNYTCKNCGSKGKEESDLHIDHIIPRDKGGEAIESNLQVLCKSCNLLKLNRLFNEKSKEQNKEGDEK